jgi:peptidyl-prolyl cis-trans isomerase C
MQSQVKEEVIAREVFSQAAQAMGLDATDDFKAQMEEVRQSILIRTLFAAYQAKNPVSDADMKAEYDRYVAINAGKEYKARHILVEKEDQAKALLAQLKKGAKFEDLAKKSSKDPGSAVKGGELDWANPTSYVKEFSDALVGLGKGKTTEAPVKSQFGFHIIRLDDVRESNIPKFDEVKPQISQHLTQQNLAKYQEELRSKAKIE